MRTTLDHILAQKHLEVASRRPSADLAALERSASAHAPRGFRTALAATARTQPAIIAEIKKASPSRGLIRPDFDPPTLARALASNGAACLSVLTDEPFFQGSLDYLDQASAAVTIPCLRKDFTVDPFQVLEARAHHADAILLIVAALTDTQLATLRDHAHTLSLDVLCEVHSREEAARAIDLGFDLIGVNSRDLRTFEMHPELLFELAATLPKEAVLVAESGLRNAEEIARLRTAGYHAFLIGETLMRQPDPGAALAALLQPQPAASV